MVELAHLEGHTTTMDEEIFETGDLFQDPKGFYPDEPEPTFAEHQMLSGQKVRVRLVGSHPLYVRRLPQVPSIDRKFGSPLWF